MANLENLLAVLGGPISVTAKKNKTAVKIDYQVAVQKRVVTDTSDFKTLLSYNKCIRNVGFRTFPMHL
jgi:hypothetical protein